MSMSPRDELVSVLGPERVREAGHDDLVSGVAARWVAHPENAEQVAAAVEVSSAHGLRVVPKGSGSKLDWGNPPDSVDLLLDLSGLRGIVRHAAGDLVLRVKAGTALDDIQREISISSQQLSLDPLWPEGTVGGAIATAAAGPCRQLYGSVRDLLIGITVVRADGTVTVSGGDVVKNVAGYDLGKLYTGSYGTLGVITEAVFRLHPRAPEHRWISTTVPDARSAQAAADAVRRSQAMPTAIEVWQGQSQDSVTVCVEIEGHSPETHTRAEELSQLVSSAGGGPEAVQHDDVRDQASEWWRRFPCDPRTGIALRLGIEPSAWGELLADAREQAHSQGLSPGFRVSAGVGVVHIGLPADSSSDSVVEWVRWLRKRAHYAVILSAPAPVRASMDAWGSVSHGVSRLMRRTKEQFDPEYRLAPGRFMGGI